MNGRVFFADAPELLFVFLTAKAAQRIRAQDVYFA